MTPLPMSVLLSPYLGKHLRELPEDARKSWSTHLVHAAEEFDINNPTRQAMWLAQLIHESSGFTRLTENMNYSARRLAQVWPNRFADYPKAIDLGPNALARSIEGDPQKIANCIYANRMGNGAPSTGDGWRYRGRYPLQLTGRDAYENAAADLNMPELADDPDAILRSIPQMARICGWFVEWKHLNAVADERDFREYVYRWNGGYIGLDHRSIVYRDCMFSLGMA